MLHTDTLPNQGIYVPLSQAMTDSESDEEIEIHNSTKHRFKQPLHQQQQQQQHLDKLDYQQQQKQNLLQTKNTRRIPPNTLSLHAVQPRRFRASGTSSERGANQQSGQQLQNQQPNPKHQTYQSQQLGNGHHPSAAPSSYTTNMQQTFRSVMLTDLGMHGGELTNFNSDYDADNVAILGSSRSENDKENNEPMSPTRRCCFIASLLLCMFAVFGFVWLVPCGEGSACPAPVDRVKTHNWLNNYTKIELKGGVNVVSGLRTWENNLIFLYRGDEFFPEYRQNNFKRNGIISLIGSSGAVAWYYEMVDEPVAIDCTLLDVDHNGRPDCLVTDEYGELGAINPVSGQWHWRYKERSARKVDAFDFPLILPDLDGDGVLEILLISSVTLEQRTKAYLQQQHRTDSKAESRNILRILSGRQGKPIGEGFKLLECDALRKLQLENSQLVTFSCVRNNTEAQRSKTLAELYALITNKSIGSQKLLPASKISQHRHYGQRKEIDSQRNIYSLSGRELIVENRGKCPKDCNVTLVLSEMRNGKTHIIRNFTKSAMYGMVPAQWHFKNTKNKMSGFVMKFWKWHSQKGASSTAATQASTTAKNHNSNVSYNKYNNVTNSINDNAIKSSTKHQKDHQSKKSRQQRALEDLPNGELNHEFPQDAEFDYFQHLIQKRDTYNLPAKNQSKTAPAQKANLLIENYKMQLITETVILVLFIGADTRIENTSQSNIIQFCRNDSNEVVCQPDLNNQENSMLIADLDQDGSQELVSYMSTFVQTSVSADNNSNWKLDTYVRLLRLQSELPAFYDGEKHNYGLR